MIIQRGADSHSLEPLYDFDGSIRVYARTAVGVEESHLYKMVHSPYGWSVLNFDSPSPVFYVVSPVRDGWDGDELWFFIAGKIDNVLLSAEAIDMKTISMDGGHISYSDSPFITRRGFAFIHSVSEEGYASIHLVGREICDDVD